MDLDNLYFFLIISAVIIGLYWRIMRGIWARVDSIEEPSRDSEECLRFEPGDQEDINPATGLPMIGGRSGVDLKGNPYGIDLDNHVNPATGLPMIEGGGVDVEGNPYGINLHKK